MQQWNGWGDATVSVDLSVKAHTLLRELLGQGNVRADYPLEKYIDRIPASRLPHHPLISTQPKKRLDHSHGQSLSDWIGLRGGTLQRFPDGVALPVTLEDVTEILDFSKKHNIVIIPFGGGTSVVGHLQVPEENRPVLSLSLKGLNRLIELNPANLLATFESGVLGLELERQLMAKGFTLGHYPQSFEFSSLGGWVVTRSSGQQSSHYGSIEQLFAGGELITPGGLLRIPPFPGSAAGPDLRHLVLGSEGRMGVLTRVLVRISKIPEKDDVYGIFFPSWDHGRDAVRALAEMGIPYSMIRLSNSAETMTNLTLVGQEKQVALLKRYLRLRGIPDTKACMCLIGFTGTRRLVKTARRESFSILHQHKGVYVGKAMGEAWKKNRFRAPYLRNTLWDNGYAVDTVETAVTWDKVTPTLKAIENVIEGSLAPWNEKIHVFSHLSHIYSTGSSIYSTFIFRLADTPEETLERWKTIKKAVSQTIVKAGGTISHQHGVGVDHKPYLEAEKGSIGIGILKQLFAHTDPEKRMNPSKLLS
ncbi:MAG: FAD-binding oxidoreductase [Deltaproteobacteria bacterium]|nr:FAD-binding oxidoreductase [Deltaproteobacteria bacterium]